MVPLRNIKYTGIPAVTAVRAYGALLLVPQSPIVRYIMRAIEQWERRQTRPMAEVVNRAFRAFDSCLELGRSSFRPRSVDCDEGKAADDQRVARR